MIGPDKLITLGNFPAEMSENEGRSLTVGFRHAFIILLSEIVVNRVTLEIYFCSASSSHVHPTLMSYHSFVPWRMVSNVPVIP